VDLGTREYIAKRCKKGYKYKKGWAETGQAIRLRRIPKVSLQEVR